MERGATVPVTRIYAPCMHWYALVLIFCPCATVFCQISFLTPKIFKAIKEVADERTRPDFERSPREAVFEIDKNGMLLLSLSQAHLRTYAE